MASLPIPQGAKLSTMELTELVTARISEEFPPSRITDLTCLAVDEVISSLGNFVALRFSLNALKNQANQHIDYHLLSHSKIQPLREAEVRLIQEKVSRIFDEVFECHQTSILDERDIPKLLNVYHKFTGRELDHFCVEEAQMFTDFYRDIDVQLPIEQIEKQQSELGCFQLRPINPLAKKLIIGCGNGRLSDGGSRPNYMGIPKQTPFYCPSTNQKITSYNAQYSLKHNHPQSKEETIDPELGSNPTVVAFFGKQPLAHLYNGQKFDEIVFEGYFSDLRHPHEVSDVQALLKENGKVLLTKGGAKVYDITHLFINTDIGKISDDSKGEQPSTDR